MRILIASSEAVPYSKTGGLADVAAALSKALARLGHETVLVVPFYPRALPSGSQTIESTGRWVHVRVGDRTVNGEILEDRTDHPNLRVLLIRQSEFFDRQGLYCVGDADYADNCARFVFFSRAVLEAARALQIRPDIVHANDWQTGLVPALLEIEYRSQARFVQTASIFTIHNLAFQGNFPRWEMELT
ncbi:MAG TPA: glycogen synthase GlgA, partial [Planctomycetaceae bacterium]|nr:glycogen synthase GlgA [Planctomycetaceae bacterium]